MGIGNIPRTHTVKSLHAMLRFIPLKYNPSTREGMAKIVETLRLEATPALLPERVERFVRSFLVGDRISAEKVCTEDLSLLRFMRVRKGEGSFDLDARIQIMLGRIGQKEFVLEELN